MCNFRFLLSLALFRWVNKHLLSNSQELKYLK